MNHNTKGLTIFGIIMMLLAVRGAYAQYDCPPLTTSQYPSSACYSSDFTFSLTQNGAAIFGEYTWQVLTENGYQVIPGVNSNYYHTPVITDAKQYKVTVGLDGCNTQEYYFTAYISPPLVAPTPNHVTLCQSGSANPSVVPQQNFTYEWYENGTKLTPGIFGTLSGGQSYTLGGIGNSQLMIDNTYQSLSFYVEARDYTNPNCGSTSTTVNVNVNQLPSVNAGTNQSLCLSDASISLNGSPSGGNWSGPGVSGNQFNPSAAGPGIHKLTYSYTDPSTGCSNLASKNITVGPNVIISAMNTCRSTSVYPLSATPAGGTWSGNFVDAATGIFHPNLALAGHHAVVYTYTDGNGCSIQKTGYVDVENTSWQLPYEVKSNSVCGSGSVRMYVDTGGMDTGDITGFMWFDVNDNPIMVNGQFVMGSIYDTPYLTAATTYIVRGINSSNCQSDPAFVVADVRTPPPPPQVINGNNCSSGTGTVSIASPVAGVLYRWYDSNGTYLDPTIAGGPGFNYVFSGTGNSRVDITYIPDGNDFYLSVEAVNSQSSSCNVSGAATAIIAFRTFPNVSIGGALPDNVCVGDPAFNLTGASPVGGSWQINQTQNVTLFNSGTLGIGAHLVKYNYTDEYGCYNQAQKQINVIDRPSVPSYLNITNCNWEYITINPLLTANTSYYRLYDGTNTLMSSGQSFPLGRQINTGLYSYKLEGVGTNGCNSLSKGDVQITVTDECEDKLNWIEQISYDATGEISRGKGYFDIAGSSLQSQTKSLTSSIVFASQAIRDRYGRSVANTLPAPLGGTSFKYSLKFLLDGTGASIFDYNDFSSPTGFSEQSQGNLGWYYSSNNTLEPLTPKTSYPYSRSTIYEDGSGEVLLSAGVGDQHNIGSGHEMLSGTFPVANELNDYVSVRNQNVLPQYPVTGGLFHQAVQQVSRDENGNYAVSISDKSGKLLMTARPAFNSDFSDAWLTVNNSVTSKGMVYFYLLKSEPVSITGSGTYTIKNLVTNQEISSPGSTWPIGYYLVQVNTGEVTVNYRNHYKDIAYQFYNDAGRMTCSLSPNGYKQLRVESTTVDFAYVDKSIYQYNHRGWLLSHTEPDAGTTSYMYRKDGKIRYSQNELQKNQSRFSYTHYDQLERPLESGEYQGVAITFGYSGPLSGKLEYENQQIWTGGDVHDWVKTNYDVPDANFSALTGLGGVYVQQFVRGTVSWTSNVNTTTWYSYDELGRVKWMAQKPTLLSRVFVTEYDYDFLGHVLNAVQKSFTLNSTTPISVFYHHYEYDADRRLSKTFTSLDGIHKELRALYSYYLHGPLKRIELGNQLQGVDFVYNIQGWLTRINDPDPNQDPGGDGKAGAHVNFKEDAFSMALDYYESSLNNLFQVSSNQLYKEPSIFHHIPELNQRAQANLVADNRSDLVRAYRDALKAGKEKNSGEK